MVAPFTMLSLPDDYVSVDSEDQPATFCQDDYNHGNDAKGDSQDQKSRILFRPQVTVNVYGMGGPSAGGSGAGAEGTGGAAAVNGGNTGNGPDPMSRLASELAALSQKVDQLALLGPRPVIESGEWHTNSVRSGDRPQPSTQGRINFVKEFKSVPTVMVSINSADVSKTANFRVKVYATAVDLWGFTIYAESWCDTELYGCGVSWVAIGE